MENENKAQEQVLVSVLMAVYAVASRDVLDEAIGSILRQTLSAWELLICNDGGGASLQRALEEWSERDERIRVFQSVQNHGAGTARNRCLRQARGRYLAVMDADDSCAPDRLERQVRFLEDHREYAFVGARGSIFHAAPGDTEESYWFVMYPQPADFLMTLPFVHGSLLFRREVLLSAGGYSEKCRHRRTEDYDLLMRLYAAGARGVNLEECVYYIREDEGTFQRRRYRHRFQEVRMKLKGFARLGLMPIGVPFALKPLIVGLLPRKLLKRMKQRYYFLGRSSGAPREK